MRSLIVSALAVIFEFLFLGFMSSCERHHQNSDASGEFIVKIPWQTSPGTYQMSEVLLRDISNLYEMSGKYATFVFSPSKDGDSLSGTAPSTKFIKSSHGVYVPANERTQQMATIYAHLQQLYELETQMGAQDIHSWPRQVAVGVQVQDSTDSSEKKIQNNAFYDGESDTLLFVPYEGPFLQLYINGGIIAHEHFHSLFYKLIYIPSPLKVSNYHLVFLRGLNEGIADFWGWIYTQDPSFIALSLPLEGKIRTLNSETIGNKGFIDSKVIQEKMNLLSANFDSDIEIKKHWVGLSYQIGTLYAQMFKKMVENYIKDTQVVNIHDAQLYFAKGLVESLKGLRSQILKESNHEGQTQNFAPIKIITTLMEQLSLGDSNCEMVKKMVAMSRDMQREAFKCLK